MPRVVPSTHASFAALLQQVDLAERASNIMKAMGNGVRLRIIAALCVHSQHVTALSEGLEEPQAIISQQLRILRMHGLVSFERRSGHAYYSLAEPRLRNMIHCIGGCVVSHRPTAAQSATHRANSVS